jgi:hypothetical protein
VESYWGNTALEEEVRERIVKAFCANKALFKVIRSPENPN